MNFSNFPTLQGNTGAKKVYDYLSTLATIHKMMAFSDVGLPAISGIVNELENNFAHQPDFPLTDFRNRQMVGRMVKYILSFMGYIPITGGLDERAALRDFTKATLFKTASVYELRNLPQNSLNITLI